MNPNAQEVIVRPEKVSKICSHGAVEVAALQDVGLEICVLKWDYAFPNTLTLSAEPHYDGGNDSGGYDFLDRQKEIEYMISASPSGPAQR
jgi:hypothetical protein